MTGIATIVVSIFAFFVATWSAISAHKANSFQSRQLQLHRLQLLRDQASKVALWTTPDGLVLCANKSGLPIFNICMGTPTGGIIRTNIVEPADEPITLMRLSSSLSKSIHEDIGNQDQDHRKQAITFEFRDADGNTWRRYSNGGLLLLKESEVFPRRKEDEKTLEQLTKLTWQGSPQQDEE